MDDAATRAFWRDLERDVLAHPFLSDPFVRRMAEPLSREEAMRFARAYSPHIARTRLYQASALGLCPDEDVQFVLAAILHDEYGAGDRARTHLAVYRKLLRALDIDPEALAHEPPIPCVAEYIAVMSELAQRGDWLAAAAAVGIASEWPIPALYGRFLAGLRAVPGLTDDDLELFVGHIGLDEAHSAWMRDALYRHGGDEPGRARIRRGVLVNLDARRRMLAGLYDAVFTT